MATSDDKRGLIEGYRSGLEEKVAAELAAAGLRVEYEAFKIRFTPPQKTRTYTPDFVLPNGIVIETKGRFVTADRQKHKYIKAQYPNLDVRFVFSRSKAPILKGSKTTCANWCDRYGFKWADVSVPQAWIKEPPETARLQAIEDAKKQ